MQKHKTEFSRVRTDIGRFAFGGIGTHYRVDELYILFVSTETVNVQSSFI